jgi:DNA-binding transcriptional LysR family regulator
VAPTPAGEALLPEVQRILQQAAALPDLARRAASGASGLLSLSFISSADYSILPPLLQRFRARYPQVQIELREATTDIQLEDLMQGKIDAGLLLPPLPESRSCAGCAPGAVGAADCSAARRCGQETRAGSAQEPARTAADHFPRRIAPAFHDTILSCFRDAGVTPHIGQEAIQMQTIVGLVSAGMGMALVPQSVSNLKRPGVDYRRLSDPAPEIQTGLAWRRDNPSGVLRALLDLWTCLPDPIARESLPERKAGAPTAVPPNNRKIKLMLVHPCPTRSPSTSGRWPSTGMA